MDKSVIAQHWWLQGHQARFAETKVLFSSDNWHMRMTREWLEIALIKWALNQEDGTRLSTAWLLLYGKLSGEDAEDQFDSCQQMLGNCQGITMYLIEPAW